MKSMPTGRQRGFSLLELILYMVIVGVALAGVLSTFQLASRNSADPMLRKQALTVAEMMLEQILAKSFANDPLDLDNTGGIYGCTPTTVVKCRPNTVTDLANYNDVSDYDGWDQPGVYQQDGTLNPLLANNYHVSVSVTPYMLHGLGSKKIEVNVSGDFETIHLTGYRTDYE